MTKALFTLAFIASMAYPQAIGIRSGTSPEPSHHMEAARPLLGYVTDDSNVLHAVVGSVASPMWGEPLALPDSTAIAFLPPRQEYALLESETGLSIARLSRSAVYPGAAIPNAMRRPEQVAFSPSGETVALFSSVERRIEVVTEVATRGQVRWNVPVVNPSELLRFTVSDDGELVVAAFANQPCVYSVQGAVWQQLATSYQPDAWTFLPNSHDLVLSDRAQKAIVVLPQAERAPIPARVLASGGIDANLLAANKQGSELLAVAAGTSASWSIDLLSGAITPLPVRNVIDSLTLLRDGQTFLVSTKESPVVVKLGGTAAHSARPTIPAR